MKLAYTFFLLFIPMILMSQNLSFKEKVSFKAAYTLSLTQFGVSPFSDTRPLRTGVSSVIFNVQFAEPIGENAQLSVGIQFAERGFKHLWIFQNRRDTLYSTYQQRLQYIELPITYSYHYKKWGVIVGVTASYLYHSDHRTYYDLARYTPSGGMYLYSVRYMAVPHSKDRFNRLDVGGVVGVSRNIYSAIDLEFLAQKQFIFADAKFPNSEDIAYFITLSAGIRYRFLSEYGKK
jgi:hypothetical protein